MTTQPELTADLPQSHEWPERANADALARLPNSPAIYLLLDAGGAPIQLGTTQALRRFLLARLTVPPEERKGKADVAEIARRVRWRTLATAFEGKWWYYRLARALYPRDYLKLISFGPAWFLHVDWSQPVPEIRVSERIWCQPGEFIGPWLAHKSALEALTGLWDLFDLCRYPEQVRKSPHGTRCAYADMGRCDAPCDGSVPLGAYIGRCEAAWRFVQAGPAEWLAQADVRMRQAATGLKFEQASLIKQQMQFAQRWQTEWQPQLRGSQDWGFVPALPAARRKAWKLLLFRRGDLCDGPLIADRHLVRDARAWLQEQLGTSRPPLPDVVRMEQTWLICSLRAKQVPPSVVLVPLLSGELPPDFEQALTEQALAIRGARGTPSAPAASGPRPPEEFAERNDEFPPNSSD